KEPKFSQSALPAAAKQCKLRALLGRMPAVIFAHKRSLAASSKQWHASASTPPRRHGFSPCGGRCVKMRGVSPFRNRRLFTGDSRMSAATSSCASQRTRGAFNLIALLSVAVLAMAWQPASARGQLVPETSAVPRETYFLGFDSYNDGDFADAGRIFREAAKSG